MADVIGGGWLRDSSARLFNALQQAAHARWGHYMPVTSAGRTKAEQGRLYDGWIRRLPGFSPAYPPNSPYALHVVNGGSAVDVGGRFAWAGSDEHEWLREAGPQYGFAVDAVRDEPWHIQNTLNPTLAALEATLIGDTLSAAEVADIKAHTTAEIERLAGYVRREARPRLYHSDPAQGGNGSVMAVRVETGYVKEFSSPESRDLFKLTLGIVANEKPIDVDASTYNGIKAEAYVERGRLVQAIIDALPATNGGTFDPTSILEAIDQIPTAAENAAALGAALVK